jgi:hypothetical protein
MAEAILVSVVPLLVALRHQRREQRHESILRQLGEQLHELFDGDGSPSDAGRATPRSAELSRTVGRSRADARGHDRVVIRSR